MDENRSDDIISESTGENTDNFDETAATDAEETVSGEEASEEDLEKTMEMSSLHKQSDSDRYGITPREEFTDLNSADNMSKTLLMDSIGGAANPPAVYDDDYNYDAPIQHPVIRRKKKKKKQINHTRTMGQVFLGVVIAVAALGVGIFLSIKTIAAVRDVTGMAKDVIEIDFEITENMNVDDIVDGLHENGIIEMPSLMKFYIKFTKKGEGFRNGPHTVSSGMSYNNIIDSLQSEKEYTETVTVTIPEGLTILEIGQLLEENYVCRAVDFENYVKTKKNRYDFETGIKNTSNRLFALEGYLFPDTYEFYVIDYLKKNPNYNTETWAKEAADKMMDNFENQITKKMKARMSELRMSLDEVLTLASIVQWEGNNDDNMAMISSVFLNRLADPENFPCLQSDAVYTYIDDCILKRTTPANKQQMEKIAQAYDTYKSAGLPPGPINNVGVAAINAVLYPTDTPYYFFLVGKDGTFYWAETQEEHDANVIAADLHYAEEEEE